jgi:hypothetical protein
LSFSAHSVGHTMAFLQDYAKAKHSASLIFQLIEKPTEIDSQSNDGEKPVLKQFCIIIFLFNTTTYIYIYIYLLWYAYLCIIVF